MRKTTGSQNPNSDDSTDSSYLYDEKERRLRNFVDCFLVTACEAGDMPFDSDPVETANFLKEINQKYGWEIAIDMDDIKKKLKKTDDRIKKMSPLYQSLEENNCKITKYSTSPSSQLTAQNSDEAGENTFEESNGTPAAVGGGREAAVLFLNRTLTKTDMGEQQNRLSMPRRQVVSKNFLTRMEKKKMKRKEWVEAKLIVPRSRNGGDREYAVKLRLTKAGPTKKSYTIGKPWNQIRKENQFVAGMEFNIRGFRGKKGEPCFLLQRVG